MAIILLVEDDENVRAFCQLVLERRGDIVYEAINGAQGLEWLDKGLQPDLIIMDLIMPIMDGNEFLQEMIKRGNHPPIIVLSAWLPRLDPQVRDIPEQLLDKPISAQRLERAVVEALEPSSDLEGETT